MKVFCVITLLMLCSIVSFSRPSASGKSEGLPKLIEQTRYETLIDLFKSLDVELLKSANEDKIIKYLAGKNAEIVKYLVTKYPQFGPLEISDMKDPAVTWFGLNYAMFEANGFKPLSIKVNEMQAREIPTWLTCTLSVLGSAVGITEAISGLGTFSFGSVWAVVKTVVKKYALGWLGTAVALVEIAHECF